MGTILLVDSFKMEFYHPKIPHTDVLPRLIHKIREPLEETMIASPSFEMDIKMFRLTL